MKNIKTKEAAFILAHLMKAPNIFFSWGPHDIKEVPGGISFQVQGFLYSGEVSITISHIDAGRVFFTVKIEVAAARVKSVYLALLMRNL